MPSGRVLLARPHDFVVESMRTFLTRNGFEPLPVTTDEELLPALRQPLAGAVISTAVISTVKASVSEVYRAIRQAKPSLPLALASLAGFEAMRGLAQSELGADAQALTFLDIEQQALRHPLLGTPRLLLCLRREALGHERDARVADALLAAHFGGASESAQRLG